MKAPEIEFISETGHKPEMDTLRRIAEVVWEGEAVTDAYVISVLFCESDRMQEYNRIYRGKDAPTDVLSFTHDPLPDGDNKDSKLILCDIIIDTNYVFNQVGSSGFQSEIEVVFRHALLHLLGYDHIRTKDREIMENKEHYYKMTQRGVTQSG